MSENTQRSSAPEWSVPERRLAAIFAADIAGYSRAMHADESGAMRALQATRMTTDRLRRFSVSISAEVALWVILDQLKPEPQRLGRTPVPNPVSGSVGQSRSQKATTGGASTLNRVR